MPSRDPSNSQRRLVASTRLALAALWLTSLVVIYFLGTAKNSTPTTTDRSTKSEQELTSGAAANPAKFASQFSEADPAATKTLESVLQRAGALLAFRGGFNNSTEEQIAGIKLLLAIEASQIPHAIALAGKLNYASGSLVYTVLVERWAKIDGRAALQYTLAEQSRTGLPMSAMLQWTRKQPEAAWQWFQAAKVEEPLRSSLRQYLFAGLAVTSLDRAFERLSTVDPSGHATALAGIASSANSAAARRKLLERAATLPDALRNGLIEKVVQTTKPAEAASTMDWVRSLPAEQQPPARDAVAKKFSTTNPDQTLTFLLETATPEQIPRMYAHVAGSLAESDPKAATEMMKKLPPGSDYDDSTIYTFSHSLAASDPQGAMTWAKTIEDALTRDDTVVSIFQRWHRKDPAAAKAALEASGIPAARIEKALKNLPPPRATPKTPPR